MYLIFDTETTGLPRNFKAPITETDNWPRVVQLAWQLHDEMGRLVSKGDSLIRPNGFNIPFDSEKVHGISTALAVSEGRELSEVLADFQSDLSKASFIVGHNLKFDINVLGCEFVRLGLESPLETFPSLDTCTEDSAQLVKLPGGKGGKFKLPSLSELYLHLFDGAFEEAHNATADVEATARCFLELIRRSHYDYKDLGQEEKYLKEFLHENPTPMALVGIAHKNLKEASKLLKTKANKDTNKQHAVSEALEEAPFAHLHVHSQFTILQSSADIESLVQKAGEFGLSALAITDNCNMMAAFNFEREVAKYNATIEAENEEAREQGLSQSKKKLLPILGCELNVCKDHTDKTFNDSGYKMVFLAKNKAGYQNLIKLSSLAYTEGFYYVPRVDKSLIEQYRSDLMVLSGGLEGEIASLILNVGEKQAEDSLCWWKEQFNDDFYVEINRHHLEAEDHANEVLVRLAEKHQVKLVATNNTYYINQSDAQAHDVLLCIRNGELLSTPKGRGRGYRFGFENDEYYFKSPEQMKQLFADLPEAILNLSEIVDKCEPYALSRDVLLPKFDIPQAFIDPNDELTGSKNGENAYLRHLAFEGALKRYGSVSEALKERLDFELKTIENTGYPGYFLIVQDFCKAAWDMGVWVGPGRGSAAGSAVAYCVGITNVDPIKYDLLFERFLNPDRISMPDIDIDFDDEGRGKVIDYVINKYGANQVAQIITYGTMAAKSSIRDTARVLDYPLPEADKLAKMVPDISLKKLFSFSDHELNEKFSKDQDGLIKARELRKIYQGKGVAAEVLKQAKSLEGTVRNTGIHACGVIITPDELTNFVPVATAKDSSLACTQFDNAVAENAGLLKMDFLGLKTLTLIKDAVRIIHENRGIALDPNQFPIDDEATFKLFQRGDTVGIFQYESPGMQKYMRELKPTEFADLIAMNALYRPGPLEYIPTFVKRKHGEEPTVYDLPECEEFLKETYGITVYQEQVMLLSQKLADFTKGEADTLRKAMGKKDEKVLKKMRPTFLERGAEKGHPKDKLEKIWKDWEAFASYAFNKSHSTCYAWIAYQTAYLKANYPAEYMAAVLSNNMGDIKQVTFFMNECRRMNINVLSPDINESGLNFTVNANGDIRFGLGAIRGIGEGPVSAIVEGRTEGKYRGVFDFFRRINLSAINRTSVQNLVYAGAFDSFTEMHRAQYFAEIKNNQVFIDLLLRYGAAHQNAQGSDQIDLFGKNELFELAEPAIPEVEEWPLNFKLSRENDVIGFYISAHPLDDYLVEIQAFCSGDLSMLYQPEEFKGRDLFMAVVVKSVVHRTRNNGDPFGVVTFEDYTAQYEMFIFGDTYLKFKHLFQPGIFLTLKGRIDKGRFGNGKLEFSIKDIDQVKNLRENRIQGLNLTIPNRDLNHLLIDELNGLFLENQGSCKVNFIISDTIDGFDLKMSSRSMRINPSPVIYKALSNMNIAYSLN
ncbi:MAG: hypothetical protein RIQ90_30 [Bacteroidota bacterium]